MRSVSISVRLCEASRSLRSDKGLHLLAPFQNTPVVLPVVLELDSAIVVRLEERSRIPRVDVNEGWLVVSDDYEIMVKDVPDREEYCEFKQLEGDILRLPDNADAEPHPMSLEQHRKLHEF